MSKRILISVYSSVGNRENNEDNFFVNSYCNDKSSDFYEQDFKSSLPLTAGIYDGMGGTSAGEEASLICARESLHLKQLISDCDDEVTTIKRFYHHINKLLLKRQLEIKEKLGAVACIVVVLKKTIIISNVGDSSVFFISNGEICKKSSDDNALQAYISTGKAEPEYKLKKQMKNILTQYIGMGLDEDESFPEPHITVIDRDLISDSFVVMLSDGISSCLSENLIKEKVLDSKFPAKDLVNAAFSAGSDDNMTAVVIRV